MSEDFETLRENILAMPDRAAKRECIEALDRIEMMRVDALNLVEQWREDTHFGEEPRAVECADQLARVVAGEASVDE